MNAKAIERRDMILEETEHLLDAGVWPPEIAARLGYVDVEGLQEAVRKWSPELRERLKRERWDRFAAEPSNQWRKRVRSGF
jgi:hypothetical protein